MKEEDIRKQESLNTYLQLLRQDIDALFCGDERVLTPCPACASDDFRNEFVKWGFQLGTCSECGTLFVNPRPQLDLLLRLYTESVSAQYWVEKFFMPMVENRRKLLFKPRAEFIANRFPQLNAGVIGDIGAGFGLFLEELKQLWPHAAHIAIEPSPEMSSLCEKKGLQVIPQPIEAVTTHGGCFDLLTCFELLEHLHDPANFVRQVNSMLKVGGYFYLTTLNGQGFDIQVLWEQSKAICPPQHLNFFNTASVRLLLENAGFVVEEVVTPGKLDWDIVEKMIGEEAAQVDRFWQVVAQRDGSAKAGLQNWLSENKLSSHMWVVAKKKTERCTL